MNHSPDSFLMREMLNRTRKSLLTEEEGYDNPNIMGSQDTALQDKTVNSYKNDHKITLDDNKSATLISDGGELSNEVTTGFQQILNGFIQAIQGAVSDIDKISINIGDTAVVMMIKAIMKDGQSIVFHVNSQTQKIQAKYDNFLELSMENIKLLAQVMQYFNPKLMSQIQGTIETGMETGSGNV